MSHCHSVLIRHANVVLYSFTLNLILTPSPVRPHWPHCILHNVPLKNTSVAMSKRGSSFVFGGRGRGGEDADFDLFFFFFGFVCWFRSLSVCLSLCVWDGMLGLKWDGMGNVGDGGVGRIGAVGVCASWTLNLGPWNWILESGMKTLPTYLSSLASSRLVWS